MTKSLKLDPAFVAKRYASERRFRALGMAAIGVTALFLVFLLVDIISKAIPAFFAHQANLTVMVDPAKMDQANPRASDFTGMVKDTWRAQFPEASSRGDRKILNSLLSNSAGDELAERVLADPTLVGKDVSISALLSDDADLYLKGVTSEKTDEKAKAWLDQLSAKGTIEKVFATRFFTSGDSREAEQAGILGALIGSVLTIVVTLSIALPLGVAAALYLGRVRSEEPPSPTSSKSTSTTLQQSLQSYSVCWVWQYFLNAFGMPRSTALVGGLVLSLLVLPTIIIASRAAIRSVPPSIKEAALGVGASHQQAIFHHVLPLALPGILTGTILGVSRALGETAPLLMIGMIAFIADVPGKITDAATVLPVQVYLWSDLPEEAFKSKTAATILMLLLVLFAFNAIAIYLRKRFERRW